MPRQRSMSGSVCQKCRIDRRKLFQERKYLGFSASKKRYYCGIKVHMLVTASGYSTELAFSPASESDLNMLWSMELDLPADAMIDVAGAYTCFELEDILQEDERIHLLAERGKAVKQRRWRLDVQKKISSKRQIVETVFSCITNLLPTALIVPYQQGFRV